ncbi:VTT domain-containing protein [Helcobacillus sp. ACRRO]|uniref:DedA family protein n=1 Tax=Helcobacillus sp. ACRRO TaxID=2918202 RepID=UPI001EF4B5C8|nr:VTT domain-containing protein [Helcobacillus sp. ACRRO]
MLDWIRSLPLIPAIAFLLVVIYLRAGATYALGRFATQLAHRSRLRRFLESAAVASAQDKLARWGAPLVALSFLTVGFQTAVNAAAGVVRMPLRRYLPALAVGGFLWAVIYATAGLAAFSLWWRLLVANPLAAVLVVLAIVGAAMVIRGGRRARARLRSPATPLAGAADRQGTGSSSVRAD